MNCHDPKNEKYLYVCFYERRHGSSGIYYLSSTFELGSTGLRKKGELVITKITFHPSSVLSSETSYASSDAPSDAPSEPLSDITSCQRSECHTNVRRCQQIESPSDVHRCLRSEWPSNVSSSRARITYLTIANLSWEGLGSFSCRTK